MKKILNGFEVYADLLIINGLICSLFLLSAFSLNIISNEYLLSIFLFMNVYFMIRVITYFFADSIFSIRLLLAFFIGAISTAYIVYKFDSLSLLFENIQIYIIALLIIGEIIAYTITISIRKSIYYRPSSDKSKAYLPKVPLSLESKINYLTLNISLIVVTILMAIFLFDEQLKSFWYIVFLFPLAIHIVALVPYFLFLDRSNLELNIKLLEEEDKNFLLSSIGKKLANKSSKSCRKTTKKEYEIVKECLENGLDPNEIFEDRYTLLLPSTCCGDEKLVRLLIEKGADVNFKSKLGMTPIYLATQHGAYDLTKLLIDNGAIIDVPSTKEVKSPIIESTIQGNKLIVSTLIEAGADVNIKDTEGKTALDYANEKGFYDIAKILNVNK